MLATQAPIIHVLYTDLPATSRRAANVPFLAAHSIPSSPPSYSKSTSSLTFTPASVSGNTIQLQVQLQPMPIRRAPPPPPRRNAISYHPSQPSSENPFADPLCLARPIPKQPSVLGSPRPRARALLLSSGHAAPPCTYAPRAPPPRDYPARIVASMLLTRAGRARPMRCGRRPLGPRNTAYVRSGLSECVRADDVVACAHSPDASAAWADGLVQSLADVA